MRRALQRCAASLPRIAQPSRTAPQCLTAHPTGTSSLTRWQTGFRSLHQTSLRRQKQEAAAEEDEEEAAAQLSGKDTAITTFQELETNDIVHPNIVRTITGEMGLETMTEVQSRTITSALKGTDVVAQAKTGTGKTLAFLLPVLQNIIKLDPNLARTNYSRQGPRSTADDIRALIVSPTRELAEQIAEEARRITKNTSVIVQTAVGGTQKSAGLRAIQRQGCHILVGTPGRLKDILSDKYTRVEAPDLSALVFDEADRLLDQGFWPEIQEIMRLLPTPAEKDRQTMMFSATLSKEVVQLVRTTLKPGFQFVKCVNDNEEPTHQRVPQKVVKVSGFENALPSLIELCYNAVQAAKQPGARPFKAIVYYNSTAEVSLASSAFHGLQTPAVADQPIADFNFHRGANALAPAKILEIHAKLTQGQRTAAADNFRRAESGILISSDVTARGMDFPNVTHVIQMGIPTSRDQYIHRIGRTARAGKEGEGWLIMNELEASEMRTRLRGLPLKPDDTLIIPGLDLTKAADVPASAGRILGMYQGAMKKVPVYEKSKVYLALLGVYSWLGRKDKLVQYMNNLSRFGWGLKEPPFVAPGLASKLGLSRIEGVRLGHDPEEQRDGGATGGRGTFGDRMGGRGGGGGYGGRSGGGGYEGRGGGSGGYGGDRGGFGGRSGGDRPSYGGDRGERPSYGDRGGSGGRSGGDRPSYGGGRGGYGGDRGGYGGDRGGYGGDRGGYGGDRGGSRYGGGDRPSRPRDPFE